MLMVSNDYAPAFRCELGLAILQWTALREGGLLTVIGFRSHTISRTARGLRSLRREQFRGSAMGQNQAKEPCPRLVRIPSKCGNSGLMPRAI
jgi:hypothetical protein